MIETDYAKRVKEEIKACKNTDEIFGIVLNQAHMYCDILTYIFQDILANEGILDKEDNLIPATGNVVEIVKIEQIIYTCCATQVIFILKLDYDRQRGCESLYRCEYNCESYGGKYEPPGSDYDCRIIKRIN